MRELLLELMTFAAVALGEPVPDRLPNIHFHATQCALDRDFYLDPARTCHLNAAGVAAFYRPQNDTIFLARSFKRDSLFDRSVLVHELAHYIQDVSGHFERGITCGAELEPPAYAVQNQYLQANGTNLDSYGITKVRIAILSFCPLGPR